jgi:hypothetical protein
MSAIIGVARNRGALAALSNAAEELNPAAAGGAALSPAHPI